MPESLSQLAPGDDNAHAFVERHADRPDHALGRMPALVTVVDRELAAVADGRAHGRDIDLIGGHVAGIGRSEQGAVQKDRPQMRRQHRRDLADHVLRGPREHRIGTLAQPAHADQDGLDLVGREHQGRQVEPGIKHIADAGLAAHGHALTHQRADVAIDRPHRDIEFGGQGLGGHGTPAATQALDHVEQSFGALHGVVSPLVFVAETRWPSRADSFCQEHVSSKAGDGAGPLEKAIMPGLAPSIPCRTKSGAFFGQSFSGLRSGAPENDV
ncbi:hypothetical protein BO1005MUT1_470285 [Hyphomicrobiales bacterium]|nr:hypothetical protein BO1005MUT1_470285 [Hyphomicrobiales bacterium]